MLPSRNQTARKGIKRLSLLVSGSSHSGVFSCIFFCTSVFLKGTYIHFKTISNYAPRSIRLSLGLRNPTGGRRRNPSTVTWEAGISPRTGLQPETSGAGHTWTGAGQDRAPPIWRPISSSQDTSEAGLSHPAAGANGGGGLWAGLLRQGAGPPLLSTPTPHLAAERQSPRPRRGWCLRAVAPPRAAIARPCGAVCPLLSLSPSFAEQGGAAGLTGSPPTEVASPHS